MHDPRLRPAAASTARAASVGSARQERRHPADVLEQAADDLIAVARDLRTVRSTLHFEELEERADHIRADVRRVFRGKGA